VWQTRIADDRLSAVSQTVQWMFFDRQQSIKFAVFAFVNMHA